LFWSTAEGKWIEVSQPVDADEISQTLTATAEDELYEVFGQSRPDLFYQILTTQKTGIFVLVKK
jgi:hypothetical protein